jgi:hypothetical protein
MKSLIYLAQGPAELRAEAFFSRWQRVPRLAEIHPEMADKDRAGRNNTGLAASHYH